jgi:hypothetical protein
MSTIVDAGESDAVVRWTGRDDTPVARFAAREFRDYAEALSGAALPVSEGALPACDRAASAVTIAAPDAPVGEALSAADDALDGRGDDAFAARTAEDAVALAGTTPRGTLYAVYALLERFGVRFFAPSFPFYEGHAEHVPDHPSLTVSDGFAEEPSFDYRRKYAVGVSVTPGTLPTLVDWLAKARHNVLVVDTDYEAAYGLDDREAVEAALVDPLRKRGLTLEAGGHNFHRYLPRAEYAADHPEWFVDDYNVFDLSDDDAVATLTENIAEDLATKPEVDIFDAWPPDAASWPPEVIEAFGSVANAYAHAVERIDEELDDALSDREVAVEAIAYSSHVRPPDAEHMYGDDVVVDFAPDGQDRSIRVPTFEQTGEDTEEGYDDWLRAWRSAFDGPLGIYEYYRRYSWHSLPVVLPELIGREIPYYESVGVDGIGTYAEPADWITYELTHALVAALSWDADLDAGSYVERYLSERYGPAADAVGAYVERVEAGSRALFTSQKEALRGRHSDLDAVAAAREAYTEASEHLDGARDICASDTAGHLLARLAANAEYAVADLSINYHELREDPDAAARARERTAELVERHTFDGVVLNSRWSAYKTVARDLDDDAYDRMAQVRYRREW